MEKQYLDTFKRLNELIYEITVGEEDARKRLIFALEYKTIFSNEFPEELQKHWKYIESYCLAKTKNDYKSSYYNSLIIKRKKTCARLIRFIVDISILYKSYLKRNNLL